MACVGSRVVWGEVEDAAVVTVGIVQCKVDFYVNVIRVLSRTCLKYCCVKYCEPIYNVLQNEERFLPPDTL